MSESKREVGLFGVDFQGSCSHCAIDKTIIPELMSEAAQSVVKSGMKSGVKTGVKTAAD